MMTNKIYFTVPGFQKAGTTYLHKMLIQHSDIYLTKSKELEYFSKKINSITYEENFDKVRFEKCYGDISPQYLYNLGTAKKIKRYRKDAKIIILIRDPIERFLSHARMGVRRGEITSIDSLLNECDSSIKKTEYYKYTLYDKMIKEYLNCFPLEQFLFIDSNLLLNHPQEALYKIENFLQVEHFDYKDVNVQVHKGGVVKFETITSIINFLESRLKPYKRYIKSVVSLRYISKILFLIETQWNVKSEDPMLLSSENQSKLLRIFQYQYKYIKSLENQKHINFEK